MDAEFDIAAVTYDHDFTHSQIGKMQRDRVWKYLDLLLKEKGALKILELNCGTGEDALKFARKGNKVIATDISEKMLEIASAKSMNENVTFFRLDLNEIESYSLDADFDLVFSNFGGLNCIDTAALLRLGKNLPSLLKQGGEFVAIVMPRNCVLESLYFLMKGNKQEAFRRKKESVMANVSGKQVKTWYYSPKEFDLIFNRFLKKRRLKPIGFFVPPSYMEKLFSKRQWLLKTLNTMEKRLGNFSWQASLSDHYFIQYGKK